MNITTTPFSLQSPFPNLGNTKIENIPPNFGNKNQKPLEKQPKTEFGNIFQEYVKPDQRIEEQPPQIISLERKAPDQIPLEEKPFKSPILEKKPSNISHFEKKNEIIKENISLDFFDNKGFNGKKSIEELEKTPDSLKRMQSNEEFLFQREIAGKPLVKNDSLNSFAKVFNVEKKDKKTEKTESSQPIQNISNIPNNDKNLKGIINNGETSPSNLKFNSPKELFNWISKIISKTQIKSGETLTLQVRDNNLGDFNISAQKGLNGPEINMAIVSKTKESDDFFKSHEKDLLKSLESAGVKIGKMEIVTTDYIASSEGGETNMNDNSGSFSDTIDGHLSQKDQLERDGQRRREIWSRFQDLKES